MRKLFYTLLLICSINSCMSDKEEQEKSTRVENTEGFVKLSPNRPNLNISILLDLSDRINPEKYPSPAMNYYERDLGYINSIAKSFEWHLRNKQIVRINDQIQLYIDPEPADKNLNNKLESLNLTFSKANAYKERILNTSVLYDTVVKSIYLSAIKDNHYVGSDIWGFFKTNVKDFCIEQDYRNILIILTDGYLYHKNAVIKEKNKTSYLTPQEIRNFKLTTDTWQEKMLNEDYGFIVSRNDLQELEVLVLGINPDPKNVYEQDVLFKYWSDWLTKMNVKDFEIKTANLPTNMDKIIKDYIFRE